MKTEKGSNWQGLLKRWLSGRITAREEQELDRFAANDPFLADALEGYRRHPESDHEARIAKLKLRFQQERKKRAFPVWRIAAAVALLVVAGFVLRQINRPAGETIARTKGAAEQNAPADQAALAERTDAKEEVEQEEAPVAFNEQSAPKRIEAPLVRSTGPRSQPAPEKPQPQPAPTADPQPTQYAPPAAELATQSAQKKYEEAVAEREEALPATKETKTMDLGVPTARAPAPATFYPPSYGENLYYAQTEIADTKRQRTKEVSGVIQTSAGEPVVGATIVIPGSSRSTVTDIDGEFSLTIPAETQQLQITYLNDARNFQIGGRDSFLLETESLAMDAVIVPRYGKVRSKKADREQTAPPLVTYPAISAGAASAARPSIDSTDYRRYVRENLRYPDEDRQANVSGTVTVQFSIDRTGRPYNFLMIKSLSPGCDAEAIRLIREGPAWTGGEGSVATYSIRFDP